MKQRRWEISKPKTSFYEKSHKIGKSLARLKQEKKKRLKLLKLKMKETWLLTLQKKKKL